MASQAIGYSTHTADGATTFTKITGLCLAETGGTNPVTVDLRDGSAAGTIFMSMRVAASGVDNITFDKPVQTVTGVAYVDVGGTGTPRAIVYGE